MLTRNQMIISKTRNSLSKETSKSKREAVWVQSMLDVSLCRRWGMSVQHVGKAYLFLPRRSSRHSALNHFDAFRMVSKMYKAVS
jgi:hypothetical protein